MGAKQDVILENAWSVITHDQIYVSKGEELNGIPHIQTLGEFPREELIGKVVMVRFDSNILLKPESDQKIQSDFNARFTIKYLYDAGAKVILVSDWDMNNSEFLCQASVAEILQLQVVPLQGISCNKPSKITDLKKENVYLLENLSDFKEEVANSLEFATELSSGVDIFVNDSFSQSHKVLASTVGITRFCYACIAGFHFEERLSILKNIAEASRKPYFAIIGGGNFYDKAASFEFLASRCQGFVFVGMMAFQKILWIGPVKFVDSNKCTNQASKLVEVLVQLSQSNCNITIVGNTACQLVSQERSPMSSTSMIENASVVWEFLKGRKLPGVMALDRAYPSEINWKDVYSDPAQPLVVDIGSGNGLFLLEMARRRQDLNFLGLEINEKLVLRCLDSVLQLGIKNGHFIATNATSTFRSIVSTYPGELVLVSIQVKLKFCYILNSSFILFYLISVTHSEKDEVSIEGSTTEKPKKIPPYPFSYVRKNFISFPPSLETSFTASYTEHSQKMCPNPDFNKPEHRWRMLQRSLIEAVVDLLAPDGKVFLQSDVKAVAMRMKEQFLRHGKGKLDLMHSQSNGQSEWLEENPFGVRSDWERHVLERRDPMYRMMFSKSHDINEISAANDM
ncbi:hypothetical protein Ahy_A10g047232 isoform C [Arachis hypogaea]|uniref:Phosphoglycerate kinase n=1 Tax=Arachis hypogaea TaxID=3818 RepID=A0A445B233_ARAHY|nr:hypothetical protein Ahy_A10g047232 isoform C [Arachis hypogaea]